MEKKKKDINIPKEILRLLTKNAYKVDLRRFLLFLQKQFSLEKNVILNNLQYLNIKGFVSITEEMMIIDKHKQKIENIIEYSIDINTYRDLQIEITKEGIDFLENNEKPKKQPLIQKSSKKEISYFIDKKIILSLKRIQNSKFDFKKLIKLCEELNISYQNKCYYAVAFILRAIIDHIPPLFQYDSFEKVANNYGGKSFKKAMVHLNESSKKIVDIIIHQQIKTKEILINKNSVNYISDLDCLLLKIIESYE